MRFLLLISVFFTFSFSNILDFNSIQSSFKQTITNEEGKQIHYEGSFYALKEEKALWIYNKPISKKMYFNSNKVVILEPELEQAIITTLKNTPNIANILKNAKEIAPFTYETNFDDITYTIYTKQEQIQKIEYKDKLDNKVVIEFLNQSINGYLDASLFEVVIPQEFDIITQ